MSFKYFILVTAFISSLTQCYTFRVRNETNFKVAVVLNEIARTNQTRLIDPHSELRIHTGIFCVNEIRAWVPTLNFTQMNEDRLSLQGNACRGRNFTIRTRTTMRTPWVPPIFESPEPQPFENIQIIEE